jgi:hypothetical protein
MAYTNDLVRLAASMKIVIDAEGLSIKLKDGCQAILEGYIESLREGGCPIVLAEREPKLGRLGIDSFKPALDFWEKLNRLPTVRHALADSLKRILEKTLPDPRMDYKIVRRMAGLGSLGQRRFVAIANWRGGFIAREAKSMLPSACAWLSGEIGQSQSHYQEAIRSAVRSPDPFQLIDTRGAPPSGFVLGEPGGRLSSRATRETTLISFGKPAEQLTLCDRNEGTGERIANPSITLQLRGLSPAVGQVELSYSSCLRALA